MNGISFEKLLPRQGAANTVSVKSGPGSSSFASLLSAQMEEPAKGKKAAGLAAAPFFAPNAIYNTNTAAAEDEDGEDSAKAKQKDESQHEMIMMLCLMMMANATSSGGEGGGFGGTDSMSTLMMTLISKLTGADTSKYYPITAATGRTGTISNLPAGERGSQIVQYAMTRLGDPYSKSKRGTGNYVDCSSLVQWAYAKAGVSLPSTSVTQAKYCYDNGYAISKEELRPGDLVFWSNTTSKSGRWNKIHHVAIYAGNNKIIEAKTSAGGVVVDDLWGENGGQWRIFMYARPYA